MYVGGSDILLQLYDKVLLKESDLDFNLEDRVLKMKCLFMMKELNSCLQILREICEEGGNEKNQKVQYDLQALVALKLANGCQEESRKKALVILVGLSKQSEEDMVEGDIFKLSDVYFYIGMINFQLEDYNRARENFLKSKTLKVELKELSSLKGNL